MHWIWYKVIHRTMKDDIRNTTKVIFFWDSDNKALHEKANMTPKNTPRKKEKRKRNGKIIYRKSIIVDQSNDYICIGQW